VVPAQAIVQFDLAHTDGLVCCAVTEAGTVGVDGEAVERIPDPLATARHWLCAREVQALEQCDDQERAIRFSEFWTLKGAYLRATGTGLACPLSDFGFDLSGDSQLQFMSPPGASASEWHFALFAPSEHHRLAVAVHSPAEVPFQITDWAAGSAGVVRGSACFFFELNATVRAREERMSPRAISISPLIARRIG
jgi:4'-phosphopantetheinyl transferase